MADQAPEEGVRRAIARLHDAMNRVVSGDVSGMKALCSHRDDVTGFYGWGAYEKGWSAVSRRCPRYAIRPNTTISNRLKHHSSRASRHSSEARMGALLTSPPRSGTNTR